MTGWSKSIFAATGRYEFVLALAACSLLAGIAVAAGIYLPGTFLPSQLLILIVLAALCQVFVVYAIYRVFSENKRVIRIAFDLHEINHEYRDRLSELFSVYENIHQSGQVFDVDQLLQAERFVLGKVCRIIAEIFSTLIVRKCTVTVKLLVDHHDGKYCFTWARSESNSKRADDMDKFFSVGTGENTGFDEALEAKPGEICHFHSGDLVQLEKKGRYRNDRDGWKKMYKSAIVVPIRHLITDSQTNDVLGFLCVDTMHKNRLNNTYHVALLAAFADQMYNFISLMRHKYIVTDQADNPTSKENEHAK